jgi:hypothetical protein
MPEPIPDSWKRDVIRLLDDSQSCQFTKRGRRDFQSLLPGAFDYEIRDAFRAALRSPHLEGKPIYDSVPPGETYAFWIQHDGTDLYGKLTLLKDRKSVFIISAHIPLKGNEL